MKILQIHNEYINPGGEEVVVSSEKSMLQSHGHKVYQWILKNSSLKNLQIGQKIDTARQSIWSQSSYDIVKKMICDLSPEIVHVHNTIPQISPSVFTACHDSKTPVVQTLHNYKLICPGSNLYRNEKICESCLDKKIPYPALVHGCYRNKKDYLSTSIYIAGLTYNRYRGTYDQEVDQYIALTNFAKKKFLEGGLSEHQVSIKPNFIHSDPGIGKHDGQYVLYAGRLIPQKGVHTLLKAWSLLDESIPLKVVGHGPLDYLISQNSSKNIEYLGAVSRDDLMDLMRNATFLVFPTEWYEVFGLVLIEAFATGMPVIASRIGGVPEIVEEGESGWLFESGNSHDLAKIVELAWSDSVEIKRRGYLARLRYEQEYTQERNYEVLMNIYRKIISI